MPKPDASPISEDERNRWLFEHVPYRLHALLGINRYTDARRMCPGVKDFHPSIFEASLLHCRWFMEFLCLRVTADRLCEVEKGQREGDVTVVQLGGRRVLLAAKGVTGDLTTDQELEFAIVFVAAHKASAHPVKERSHKLAKHPLNDRLIERCASTLARVVETNLYEHQGLQRVGWKHRVDWTQRSATLGR